MKSVKKYYSAVLLLTCVFWSAIQASAQETFSPEEKKIVSEFEKQAQGYSKMRESLEEKLPPLPKDATADQIERHKTAFQNAVQAARADAKQGDLFTPAAAALIKKIIKTGLEGQKLSEFRQLILEAETKGVPLRVNVPYPDSVEQIEMPPSLLLRLPQLPKQLRYRFVGRSLLLLDRENALIVDFMTGALP